MAIATGDIVARGRGDVAERRRAEKPSPPPSPPRGDVAALPRRESRDVAARGHRRAETWRPGRTERAVTSPRGDIAGDVTSTLPRGEALISRRRRRANRAESRITPPSHVLILHSTAGCSSGGRRCTFPSGERRCRIHAYFFGVNYGLPGTMSLMILNELFEESKPRCTADHQFQSPAHS